MNNNSTFHELARSIGLTPEEEQVYLSMLELDSVSVRKVADHSGINRGAVYEALKNLLNYGLVSKRHEGKRDYFVAESPERFYSLLQDKRKELWQAQNIAKELVPALLTQSTRRTGNPLVRYYQDDDGIVTILKDVLHTCVKLDNPEYYVYSSRPLRRYLYRKFPGFTEKRIEEGVAVKAIAVGEGGDKAAHSERRWLDEPEDGYISSYVIIYGDKVAHISISEDDTPYGVVVEDAGVASMQKLLFEQIWNKLGACII